jgi:hypothetical protein
LRRQPAPRQRHTLTPTLPLMERMKRLIDDHPELAGFLTFVLWNVLVYIGLSAFENHDDGDNDIVVRFFIMMGAVGIIYVGKMIIDVLGKPGDAN